MRSRSLSLTILPAIDAVAASQWDALVSEEQPFLCHAFLAALEASGSVGAATGWVPCHLCVWQDSRLVGALPMYRKDHSYGEYVFDWGYQELQ